VVGDDGRWAAFPTRTPFTFTPDDRSLVLQAAKQGDVQLFLRLLDRADATANCRHHGRADAVRLA
jgi:hypothetical protein